MPKFFTGPPKTGGGKLIGKVQYDILKKNVGTFADLMAFRAIEVMAYMGIDLLGHAMPRVPWDTGKLRRSGRVHVVAGGRTTTVAKGSKAGTVSVSRGQLTPNNFIGAHKRRGGAKVFVSFQRESNGRDIALWTHEMINPEESRPNPPAATKPGTGPKYLEMAFNERKNLWGDLFNYTMTKGIEADLAKIANVYRKKKGKYEVDLVKLIHGKIAKKGYFGGR